MGGGLENPKTAAHISEKGLWKAQKLTRKKQRRTINCFGRRETKVFFWSSTEAKQNLGQVLDPISSS